MHVELFVRKVDIAFYPKGIRLPVAIPGLTMDLN